MDHGLIVLVSLLKLFSFVVFIVVSLEAEPPRLDGIEDLADLEDVKRILLKELHDLNDLEGLKTRKGGMNGRNVLDGETEERTHGLLKHELILELIEQLIEFCCPLSIEALVAECALNLGHIEGSLLRFLGLVKLLMKFDHLFGHEGRKEDLEILQGLHLKVGWGRGNRLQEGEQLIGAKVVVREVLEEEETKDRSKGKDLSGTQLFDVFELVGPSLMLDIRGRVLRDCNEFIEGLFGKPLDHRLQIMLERIVCVADKLAERFEL